MAGGAARRRGARPRVARHRAADGRADRCCGSCWQLLPRPRGAAVAGSRRCCKLAAIMADDDFPRHAWETGRAFATALVISLAGGLVHRRSLLGAHRLSGEVAEPMLVGALLDPEDHALSGDPAAVRPRHVGQDRVRRDPRHHPGDPVHDERGAQHPAGLSPRRARDAADRRRRPPATILAAGQRCRRSSPASASASR